MSQRTIQPVSNHPTRRHERRDGHDIADIYEARLLAHGMRSDDFIAFRSATEIPSIPDIKPVRFGRGVEPALLLPMAVLADEAPSLESEDSPAAPAAASPEHD
jgi:hypothetical protein